MSWWFPVMILFTFINALIFVVKMRSPSFVPRKDWVIFTSAFPQASSSFSRGCWSNRYAHFTSSRPVCWLDRRVISSNKVRMKHSLFAARHCDTIILTCFFFFSVCYSRTKSSLAEETGLDWCYSSHCDPCMVTYYCDSNFIFLTMTLFTPWLHLRISMMIY